jgi:two-component system sensor histidine kinase BarA
MSSALRVVDEALALERAGGNPDLARDLYQMLQKELPVYQENLRQLYEQGDIPSLLNAVHKLNGSATYCGVPALKAAAESLESNMKRGIEEAYRTGLDMLLAEIERVMQTPSLAL